MQCGGDNAGNPIHNTPARSCFIQLLALALFEFFTTQFIKFALPVYSLRALLMPRVLKGGPPENSCIRPNIHYRASRDPSHSLHTALQSEAEDSPEMTSHSKDQTVPAVVATQPCKLESLPPELIHQILDNLPVSSVLLLLSSHKPGSYLHRCVLCHPQYRHVFASQEAFTIARDIFLSLYEIATAVRAWPVDLGVLERRHEHGSLIMECISPCKECLDVLRKGLCDVLMQKFVEMAGSLSVERREDTGGYGEVSFSVLPATEKATEKKNRRRG